MMTKNNQTRYAAKCQKFIDAQAEYKDYGKSYKSQLLENDLTGVLMSGFIGDYCNKNIVTDFLCDLKKKLRGESRNLPQDVIFRFYQCLNPFYLNLGLVEDIEESDQGIKKKYQANFIKEGEHLVPITKLNMCY